MLTHVLPSPSVGNADDGINTKQFVGLRISTRSSGIERVAVLLEFQAVVHDTLRHQGSSVVGDLRTSGLVER